MGAKVLILVLAVSATPALAAPTCQDRSGEAMRCGAAGAMPVSWIPPPEEVWDREISRTPGPSAEKLLGAFCGLGLLFALIALLPDFDGWQDERDEE